MGRGREVYLVEWFSFVGEGDFTAVAGSFAHRCVCVVCMFLAAIAFVDQYFATSNFKMLREL
jgi:hypothetical protein